MCSIFPFMRPMKVLFLQRLNRFMYHRGVERSQPRFPLGPPVIYFTYPDSRKWDRTLFLYNLKMQKVMRPIKLPKKMKISLYNSRIVQIEHSILVFKITDYKVKLYMISGLSTGNFAIKQHPSSNFKFVGFALANYRH